MKIERIDKMVAFRTTGSEVVKLRQIAEREQCSMAVILRRIFRRGLALEKAKS